MPPRPLARAQCDRYLALLGVEVRRPDERSLARLLEHHHDRVPVENLSALVARAAADAEKSTAPLMPDPARFVEAAARMGTGETGMGIAIALRALLEGVGFDAFLLSGDAPG